MNLRIFFIDENTFASAEGLGHIAESEHMTVSESLGEAQFFRSISVAFTL